ncbi:MAG: amidase [Burkholderiaceae bacterium]
MSTSTELHSLSAAELSDAYRSGRLSPVEVTRAVLARIEDVEPKINAMYVVHAEAALRAAAESEARWREGRPASAIDGVPITIKENIHTAGDPSPIGTRAAPASPQPIDAPPSARVREAGAVIVGKTTMPDFGMLSSGVSSLHGITRNPWRLDRNTSGSSSGAGAAAAAGYGPLHIGTDIGGSVRLPATHNGIFGLKPSQGRVPYDPPFMGRVAGPMTRTVRDAAMLMTVLSRPDDRDYRCLPPQSIDHASELDGLPIAGLRIGVLTEMGCGLPPQPEVRDAVAAAAAALADAGARVEPLDSFLTPRMFDGVQRFFEARLCADIAAMPAAMREQVLPFIVEWATWRAASFSGSDVIGAYLQIQSMREAAVRAVGAFDFVISPTSPLLPYDAEAACPGDDPHRALEHIAFTVPYNMSEQPAASINWCASSDGLPIGVQLIGKRFDDVGVLRLARAMEGLRPAQRPWPSP